MKLEFATQQTCAPTGAVRLDPKQDVNYFETLCLFCSDNDINLSEVSDLEFEAMVTELSHFGLGFDGPLKPFWFWINE